MESIFLEQIIYPILNSIKNGRSESAFCIEDEFFTYSDFAKEICNIRGLLHERRIDNKHIGLVTNNDLTTYASIIALWLEGYCYVPLHIKQPIDRCLDIIDQVGITTILDSSKESRYDSSLVLNTNELSAIDANLDPLLGVDEDDLAYILFTSGSTGKPKGVALSRRNIGSFMDSFWTTGIDITREDKCLQCFDLTFDVSVQCYLTGLTKGACVFTVPYGEGKYLQVAGLIDEYHITFAAMAPSMLRFMRPFFDQIDMSSLKTCILTAEACPKKLLETIYDYCPDISLYDFYGPTEATIYCTYYKLERARKNKELNGIISIGHPLRNCIGYIMDEQGDILPTNEKGELCIAGAQVTQGYWNNEEKNASSFFMKTIDGVEQRFYHTGDLCYQDEDGDIMYSGRLDNQVKIQGFRIELGEIEHHAREASGKNAVCVAKEKDGNNILYLAFEGEEFDTRKVMEYMKSKMPSYMMPSHIIFIKSFPLNSNDKIDRPKIKSQYCNL